MVDDGPTIDWHLATWEGARREALRRWAALPLERMVSALEEMESTASVFGGDQATGEPTPPPPAGGRDRG